MKIVHLGDADAGGGAANAMMRLHDALLAAGFDSQVLVHHRHSPADGVAAVATRGDRDAAFPAVRDAVERQYVAHNRTGLTNTHFSLQLDGVDLSRFGPIAEADVVHLHWTASFQTAVDICALLATKPIVWTLHDFEPLTGGCHFPAGCDGYADDCTWCPQLANDPFAIPAATLRDKVRLWAGSRPTLIAPSRAMAERARRSTVAREAQATIEHVPYGIDLDRFAPRPKEETRRNLGLALHGQYVLCGSNFNSETRKGVGLLDAVLSRALGRLADGAEPLTVLTVGEPPLELASLAPGAAVRQLGRVPLERMPDVYAAADVFLHPALEDNFPCMVLESLACGTPVIAFDVDGVVDLIADGVTGKLVAAGDDDAMATEVASLLADRQGLRGMADAARAYVREHFDQRTTVERHRRLYYEAATRGPAVIARDDAAPLRLDELRPYWLNACLTADLVQTRELATAFGEESRLKSERIEELERLAAATAETLADLKAASEEQRLEIELMHRIAAERAQLIEDLHRIAHERAGVIDRLNSVAASPSE